MKFAVDIWFAPEDIEAHKESGMLGCADEEHQFDTLEEAWKCYTTPRNAFHMQLTHYPNYALDEWGDGNILAEGKTDDYIMLTTAETIKLNKIRDHAVNGGMDIDDAWIIMDIINGELEETKKQLAQAEGATQMALQHLGLQGADHDEFCRFKYGCNVYGDELEEEE